MYKAVKSKQLSKENDVRYVVIDTRTGEVLDDAQGYGFKSKKKAIACHTYKINTKGKNNKKKAVITFCRKNKKFLEQFDEDYFYYWKGNGCVEPSNREVEDYFKEYGYTDLSFTIKDFLKYRK